MTATEPTTDHVSNPSRRQMLCGLAAALFATGAAVSACSNASDSGSSGSTGTSGPAGGQTATGGATTGSGSGGATVLTALAAVPVGSGILVDNPKGGNQLVVVQPTAGQVKAFDGTCPHMGNQVDAPNGATITCPFHGSQFATATGALQRGPANKGLTEVAVKVDGTNVVLG